MLKVHYMHVWRLHNEILYYYCTLIKKLNLETQDIMKILIAFKMKNYDSRN
jgi:hypothetical protein